MQTSPLSDFLTHALSQKSVSLVLTGSDADASKTTSDLQTIGFVQLTDVRQLEKAGKYYLTALEHPPATLRDIVAQYGSGQISLHNKDTGEASWVNPVYSGTSLLLVVSKDLLQKIENEGHELRESAGLALQI